MLMHFGKKYVYSTEICNAIFFKTITYSNIYCFCNGAENKKRKFYLDLNLLKQIKFIFANSL